MSGVVVWLTGLPASGKSTFAAALRERRPELVLLDGDEVRAALVPTPGFSAAARDAFYATLGRVAALLAHQGHAVVVAATAHRRLHRDEARRLAPRFLEVWLRVDRDTCERRDPKGLYADAREGHAPDLPGAMLPYEEPHAPEVVARGGRDEEALAETLARIAPLITP